MTRLLRTLVMALVLVPTAHLLAPSVAHAGDGVVVSVSEAGVFDPATRWVPGDVRTERFTVRNEGRSPALVSLQVFTTGSAVLEDDLTLTARRDDGAWQTVGDDPVDLGAEPLGVGESAPIVVRAAFDPASSSATRSESVALSFQVTLAQDRGNDDDSSGGLLPDTGSPVSAWLVWLAAALVGVGGGLLVRARATAPSGTGTGSMGTGSTGVGSTGPTMRRTTTRSEP